MLHPNLLLKIALCLDIIFFLSLTHFVFFVACWKPQKLSRIMGTKVARHLVWSISAKLTPKPLCFNGGLLGSPPQSSEDFLCTAPLAVFPRAFSVEFYCLQCSVFLDTQELSKKCLFLNHPGLIVCRSQGFSIVLGPDC